MAQSCRSGVVLSVMDGFFAATERAKDLTLVTRDVILHHLTCHCSTRGTNKWPTVKSHLTVPLAVVPISADRADLHDGMWRSAGGFLRRLRQRGCVPAWSHRSRSGTFLNLLLA